MYMPKAADTPSHIRHCCRLRRCTFVVDVYAVHSGHHSHHRCCAPRHAWSLLYLAMPTSTVSVSAMDMNGEVGRDMLSKAERMAVAAVMNAILFRCQLQRSEGRMRAAIRAQWRRTLQSMNLDVEDIGAICDAVLQVCYAMGCGPCGAFPKATPRWWMMPQTGGTWEDLRQGNDAMAGYFKDKLRMSPPMPRLFREIEEALSPFLQWRVTSYREPLQHGHIVAYYALYRWASREMYESGTCSFNIGRSSRFRAMGDENAALLSTYPDKVSWPTGQQKAVVLRTFADKGFPNCHGCIDCTHIFIDKPVNCPGEDYYDRKCRFSDQAQVVVDLNLWMHSSDIREWTACLEEPRDEDTLPSRQEYLKPYDLIPHAFYPKGEEVVIDEDEEDEDEEDDDEETLEEGSYSEYSEDGLSEEEEEEEEETGSEWEALPEEAARTGTEAEDPEAARKREEIATGKRQLEFASGASLRIGNDPTRDPEPPKREDGDLAAATPSATRRRRSRSSSSSSPTRPAVRPRTDAGDRPSSSDAIPPTP
ncbi:hypothetical protein CBR_g52230 [Chara braunii]|uniref:DDE Tnp4 domain-containing protein n=1 Tax=Chara braunii TaxID=69332 RepID=A0A388M9U6_CHABU|nr:hypothetical protein CBR_g52230 [Chara braunii]|eukprot:GBG91344.1 hypothetical protein CBR_g52230 [Chara braunii]